MTDFYEIMKFIKIMKTSFKTRQTSLITKIMFLDRVSLPRLVCSVSECQKSSFQQLTPIFTYSNCSLWEKPEFGLIATAFKCTVTVYLLDLMPQGFQKYAGNLNPIMSFSPTVSKKGQFFALCLKSQSGILISFIIFTSSRSRPLKNFSRTFCGIPWHNRLL